MDEFLQGLGSVIAVLTMLFLYFIVFVMIGFVCKLIFYPFIIGWSLI